VTQRPVTQNQQSNSTHFLNVDLDLKSEVDLGALVEALGERVVVLHSGKRRGIHHASLELYEFSRYVEPETCIARFVQLVRHLPTPARRLWNGATERQFNVGIQAGSKGVPFTSRIKTATLRRVAEIGGEIVLTVYAPPERRRRRGPPE
jgi:hypothetical protein